MSSYCSSARIAIRLPCSFICASVTTCTNSSRKRTHQGRHRQAAAVRAGCAPYPARRSSADALHEFVGRYREIGIDEFIFYWLTTEGHPVFPERGLSGVTITGTGEL